MLLMICLPIVLKQNTTIEAKVCAGFGVIPPEKKYR